MDEELAVVAETEPEAWGTFTLHKAQVDNDDLRALNEVFDIAERNGCVVSYVQHTHFFITTIEKLKVIGPARFARMIDVALHGA